MTGMLATISRSGLSPAVVERARTQLEIALGGPPPGARTDFVSGAGAWLERAVPTLVDVTEFRRQVYDFWESWIAAQRRLGRGERLDRALVVAIEAILSTSTDLARPGPSLSVLGRLLSLADLEASAVVREGFISYFADPDRITSHDLWVLTSLLSREELAPWFSEDLILPDDADWMFRRRVADRIGRRWPEAAFDKDASFEQAGLAVDHAAGSRWLARLEEELQRPLGASARELVDQLVIACRINEAAARLAAGETRAAGEVLDDLEEIDTAPEGSRRRRGTMVVPLPLRPGQPLGRDGEWAVAFEEAGRNAEERLKWLRVLRNAAGTDLGPIDGESFVRVVYRGAPPEVRSLAQTIVVEQLASGPNIAVEMLEQFPGASANEQAAETVRRFTGRLLPRARSQAWAREARLALVEHALRLRRGGFEDFGGPMAAVVEAYTHRRAALEPETPGTASLVPHEAAAGLHDAWRDRAAAVTSGDTTLTGVAELERRHATRLRLAEGPLQQFVATQVGVLEAMAYVVVAEQPRRRASALAVLADSARQRGRVDHVLEQAVEAERAIGRVWALLVGVKANPEARG